MAPFCFTFICTSLGLFTYFCCGYSNAHINRNGGGAKDDRTLQKELASMSLSKLYRRAMNSKPDEDQVSLL
jgi:hypothetical protein